MSEEVPAEAETPPEIPEPPPDEPELQLRRQHLRDHEMVALGYPDPLATMVGLATVDLSEIGHGLKRLIVAKLEQPDMDLEQSPALLPAINAYGQLARQAERFAVLESHHRPQPPGQAGAELPARAAAEPPRVEPRRLPCESGEEIDD